MTEQAALSVQCCERMGSVGASWAALVDRSSAHGRPFMTAPYLAYAQDGHGRVFRAECRAGSELVAGLTGWVADGKGHPYLEPSWLLRDVGFPDGPHLVVGCPGAFTGAILMAGDQSCAGSNPARVVETVRDALLRQADTWGCRSLVALYLDSGTTSIWAGDVTPALVNFDTVIATHGGRDEWMRALPGHRRRNIEREMRQFATAGLSADVEASAEVLREAAPILVASEARFGNTMVEADVLHTLERQRRHFGESFVVFTARDKRGRLVACATALLEPQEINMRFCGVEREAAGTNFEYFNVCYYLPIAYAAKTGRGRVRLGMESFEAKLLRGATLEPRWAFPMVAPPRWEDSVRAANRRALSRLSDLLVRFPQGMNPHDYATCAALAGCGDIAVKSDPPDRDTAWRQAA